MSQTAHVQMGQSWLFCVQGTTVYIWEYYEQFQYEIFHRETRNVRWPLITKRFFFDPNNLLDITFSYSNRACKLSSKYGEIIFFYLLNQY